MMKMTRQFSQFKFYASILESTHIRILVFSPAGVGSCNAKIDNNFNEKCQRVNENFYVVPWNPEHYREGLHSITVTVVDKNNRTNEVTQPFRLDEKQAVYFDPLAQFILHTNLIIPFSILFSASILLCIVPLIFCRIWHELIRGEAATNLKYSHNLIEAPITTIFNIPF